MKPLNEKQYALQVEQASATKDWQHQIAWLIEMSGLQEGDHVLDYGCNTGFCCASFQNSSLFSSITGIDINEWALERARSLDSKSTYLDYNQWVTGDDKPKYDFIMMNHVLGHITQVERVMKKLVAQLKVKGRLVICTPNRLYNNVMWLWDTLRSCKRDTTIEHNWTTKELLYMGSALEITPTLSFMVGDYPYNIQLKFLQKFRKDTGVVFFKTGKEETITNEE